MCDMKHFYTEYRDYCTPNLSQYDNYHDMQLITSVNDSETTNSQKLLIRIQGN